jgi:Zn-dependent protease
VFQFKLRGIPVQVHFSHVLIALLLGWSFAQSERAPTGWPGQVLVSESHPDRVRTLAAVIIIWVVIISVSVLVHELGHALSARRFGLSPEIHLIGLGGRTLPNAKEELPWHQEVLMTLAGPSAGLALGLVAGLVLFTLGPLGVPVSPMVEYTLKAVFAANLFWALVNLVPVTPLDGGHIARAVLMHLFGRKGFLYAQIITLVFAGAGLGLSVFLRAPLLGLLFGLWGFRAVSVVQAYQRGELPLGAASHPLAQVLETAEQKIREGALDEATRAGDTVLRSVDVPPTLTSRAHLLLGWIAVKQSNGVEALRHFRQVKHQPVPPAALAAAHSLAGDDTTALPLWAEAARASDDATLRTEYAGALLRLGREPEARQFPAVRLSAAFLAAERVHYLRGEYEQAAHAAEGAFRAEPKADFAYTAACDWARAKDAGAALRCLTLAAQNGYADADAARADADLASLRDSPAFEAWLQSLRGPPADDAPMTARGA